MKRLHATRKERHAWIEEFGRLGFPVDDRYEHELDHYRGKSTRRQRQEGLASLCIHGRRSRAAVVVRRAMNDGRKS
jgi:hypothetical protein